eukprot:213474-Lingulodinium_polyedra.AAC.1
MALILNDIDYQRDSFPTDLLMAVGQPSFHQAYSGLVTFGEARPPPVSTTVDVGFERQRAQFLLNLPLRALECDGLL